VSTRLASMGTKAESTIPIPKPKPKCGQTSPIVVVAAGIF